ncbi:hypothetical protein DFJ43DRAFT_1089096 [Lentinula guzmanii]|uniref:WHIM1 domain-containing protein n=1 Tax=Lentinula guzmanii TaxID=2804957 RepID=A0AA38JDU5_9AGAR|nr:hypothetical protein DFJ43DRAFT_1089096 [Lentinula guzmanii]
MATTAPRGHVCPSSNAKHPSDRWESLFIYSFICKFTNLRGKVEGLETPMDFENALLLRESNVIVTNILTRFILNLRPQTRNLSEDQISSTVASVLGDYFKTSERTIFWNDDLHKNVDPFPSLEGGFFAADWDFKLKILRQLVELQLSHSTDIKAKIDRAWGANFNKNKKKDPTNAPPDPLDPDSRASLQMLPLGQDSERKRYWVADKSPRVYISTNPWKITAIFQSVSSTRVEYVALIENVKQTAPRPSGAKEKAKKWTKQEASHHALVEALEARLEIIDAELARVAKVQRKIEQRKLLMAQAELRQTRTRRQTRRPDYVYNNGADSEDDGDEYRYQEDEGYEEYYADYGEDGGSRRSLRQNKSKGASEGQRRSSRSAVVNANGKREADQEKWSTWRGERRSARLGAPEEILLDYVPPTKRARTDDSAFSTDSSEAGPSLINGNQSIKVKATGAAALKPTEFAAEQIAGRKKSKYWIYAVEPIPGVVPASSDGQTNNDDGGVPSAELSANNGPMDIDLPTNRSLSPLASGSHATNADSGVDIPASPSPKVQALPSRSMAGSLSPLSP